MINTDFYMLDDDFDTPILAIDDEMPLPRRDYYIQTEEPIKPYTPTPVVTQKPPVVAKPIIVPEKPKVEFNPPTVTKDKPFIAEKYVESAKNDYINANLKHRATPEVQPAKSINPLYVAGAIVAIILIYKILK